MALQEREEIAADAAPGASAVTYRALAGGVLLAILVAIWNTFVEYVAHTARMNITHFPIALFVPFAVLALGNGALRRMGVRWAFTGAEMLTMLGLGFLGGAIPAYGLTSYFLGLISVPFYRATPENQWGNYFHQYLPEWLIPSNDGDAMRYLFEGLPSADMPIPWGVWAMPLLGWGLLLAAILAGSFCLSVIVRKQWAEHERLAYPLLQPAADLAEAEARVPFFKNRFFWAGASIPFLILSWNIIGYFVPGFPRIRLGPGWMNFGAFFPRMHISFNFYTIGFAYFANIDVLFSIWAFYLFYCTQIAFYRRIGVNLSNKGDSGDATTSLQAGGAFVALVLWGLWLGRSHIRDVFMKAWRNDYPVDDSDELLSYRAAAIGFVFSVLFVILWLSAAGVAWYLAITFGLGLFLLYLGAARVIAETGVVYFSIPMTPDGILPYMFGGPNAIDASSHTALRVVGALRSQNKGMFLPPLVHLTRIADLINENKRRLVLGVAVTLVAGISTAVIYTLYLGYTMGAYNFNDLPFSRYPISTYDGLVKTLKGEETWEENRYIFLLAGVAIFWVTSVMRYRFTWWPLAPIGMVVPPTHAVHSIFSVFCAWGIKSIIMRIGGVGLYRKLRPLFMGLLVGHGLGVLLSFIVDQIWFPGQGHGTHSW